MYKHATRLVYQMFQTKLYSKDECAPDAQSAKSWFQENVPGANKCNLPSLSITFEDYIQTFYQVGQKAYCVEYSCGAYEEVYEVTRAEMAEAVSYLTASVFALTVQPTQEN